MIRRECQKDVILFVHGFGSSSSCWKRLTDLLEDDEEITSRYELATWDYPTKWIELQVFGRIPRLQELGRSLADTIDSPRYHDRSLTLVGHSQGGLVIQSYFVEMLNRDEADGLRHIRQAIFFATPSEGSTTLMPLRLLAATLLRNPQELTLRVLNPDVADMKAKIRERIVGALQDDPKSSWRIPIHAFCGLQDDIVPEPSARPLRQRQTGQWDALLHHHAERSRRFTLRRTGRALAGPRRAHAPVRDRELRSDDSRRAAQQ